MGFYEGQPVHAYVDDDETVDAVVMQLLGTYALVQEEGTGRELTLPLARLKRRRPA